MPQFAPGVIVFEKQPRWAPELRHHLPAALPVRPCRAASHAQGWLRDMPGSLLILDLDQQAASCLLVLGTLLEYRLEGWPVVIAAESDFELEWAARELGAVAFLPQTIGGETLAATCLRLLGSALPATAAEHSAQAAHELEFQASPGITPPV